MQCVSIYAIIATINYPFYQCGNESTTTSRWIILAYLFSLMLILTPSCCRPDNITTHWDANTLQHTQQACGCTHSPLERSGTVGFAWLRWRRKVKSNCTCNTNNAKRIVQCDAAIHKTNIFFVINARCYAESGYATVSRLSVRITHPPQPRHATTTLERSSMFDIFCASLQLRRQRAV